MVSRQQSARILCYGRATSLDVGVQLGGEAMAMIRLPYGFAHAGSRRTNHPGVQDELQATSVGRAGE